MVAEISSVGRPEGPGGRMPFSSVASEADSHTSSPSSGKEAEMIQGTHRFLDVCGWEAGLSDPGGS